MHIQSSMLFLLQLMGPAIFFVQPTSASSAFHPSCTLPSNTVNFVSAPNVRSTLDILWSSLFTLLICTWTVQHLNIPEQKPDCTKWQQKLKENLIQGLTKIKWMLVTLIVPEFLVGRAFQDFLMAKKSCQQMKEFAEADSVPWTLTHAYYANMGGFVLKVRSSSELHSVRSESTQGPMGQVPPSQPRKSQEKDQSIAASEQKVEQDRPEGENSPLPSSELPVDLTTITKRPTQPPEAAPQVEADASDIKPDLPHQLTPEFFLESTEYAYPNAYQLYILRQRGIIECLPEVSVKWMEAKSKGDAFVKGTAVLQVSWLVIQVIARGIKKLPVSQLEIAVIAFAACTLLTYIFSWSKPQNIAVADLACSKAIARESIEDVANACGRDYGVSWFQNLNSLDRKHGIDIFRPIPNDADFDRLPGSAMITLMDIGMVIAGTIFGAVHLIAWDFHFPTQVESLLWKLASVYLAAVLPCYYGIAFLFEKLGWIEIAYQNSNLVSKFVVFFSILAYVLARLCLLVLIFRCLFFLPIEAFVNTWASEAPYLQ